MGSVKTKKPVLEGKSYLQEMPWGRWFWALVWMGMWDVGVCDKRKFVFVVVPARKAP